MFTSSCTLDFYAIGTRVAGSVQSTFPLNNFNSFHCIIIKHENVCWHNTSAKFNNQPDPMKHFGVMALELAKIAKNKPCPLFYLNIFQWIIIKLCGIVSWHNILAKFNNQPDPMKHFGVMALELAKLPKINLVCSVTWIFFNGSSSNFVTLFVGIISWPSSITSQIPSNFVTMFESEPHCLKWIMALDLSETVQIKLVL